MSKIIQYNDTYKEELFKFINSSFCVTKGKNFILSNEFKFLTQGKKKIKGDVFVYLEVDKDNKIEGVAAITKEGLIVNLSTDDKDFGNLLKKAIDTAKTLKLDKIEAYVNAKNILYFNNNGFKSIRYLSQETDYNFLVRKTII